MTLTIHIYYTGSPGAARAFAEEMCASGTVQAIREEPGNLKYDYYFPMDDPDTVLLIDRWSSQEALDAHHASPMMQHIARLREHYGLCLRVERYVAAPPGC